MNDKRNDSKHQQYNWEDIDRLNKKLEVSWDKPKEEVWMQMNQKMDKPTAPRTIHLWERTAFKYAVAAMIVLFIGIGSFVRFYTTSYETVTGQHQAMSLPDGSAVTLNAESSISYHPYWWSFSRTVEFEGEGYFEVEKGSTFSVKSSVGTTSVLGTSFNVYARDDAYQVACITGKVSVVDASGGKEIILNPDEKAEWENGNFLKSEFNTENETAWMNNQFVFTATPIRKVFDELERQYGIKINSSEEYTYEYTGNFSMEEPDSLAIYDVCKSFNLKFVKDESGVFRIMSND